MAVVYNHHKHGFTLAELLIALAILGVIATFTIPKVLQAQQSHKHNAIAKQAIAAMVNAYDQYRAKNTVTANTKTTNLLPYFNYVKYDTTSTFDYAMSGTVSCDSSSPCLWLHNGALVQFYNVNFAGTSSTNAVWFIIDPDGANMNTPQGGSLEVALYFNGRIATWKTLDPNTVTGWGPYSANPAMEPSWFSW